MLSLRADPAEAADFEADSAALADAFSSAGTPFLAAYPGQVWPFDSTVAIASLTLHDHLLAPRFTAVTAKWVADARARLDPRTGLLPHRADARLPLPLARTGRKRKVVAQPRVRPRNAWLSYHFR